MTFDIESLVSAPSATCPNELRCAPIAIIGEAPGREEVEQQKPFVGASGKLMWSLLGRHNICRSDCAILNVSQLRPSDNDFNLLPWDSHAVQDGIHDVLYALDNVVKPNLVIVLGNAALHLATHGTVPPARRSNKHVWPNSISDWRGSIFWSHTLKRKCLATVHPAAVLRQYELVQLLRFDLGKVAKEFRTSDYTPTIREFNVQPSLESVLNAFDAIVVNKPLLSVDIEGGIDTLKCISFATSATSAFIVPFTNADGSSFWSQSDEELVWKAMAKVLCDPSIPKVLQNALYDCFVMAKAYRTPIRGVVDDTMLKHWELLPELEKSLAVQASIYTDQPYYKGGRTTEGMRLWEYCCTDSAITYEINKTLDSQFRDPDALKHYRFNVSLLAPLLYSQVRGIPFSTAMRDKIVTSTKHDVYALRVNINSYLGTSLPVLCAGSKTYAMVLAHERCCYKKAVVSKPSDLVAYPKADYVGSIHRIASLIDQVPNLSVIEWGELETLLDVGVNVDSPKQMQELLYQKLALPIVYKKERGRLTDKVSTDALALLTIYRKTKNETVKQLLKLRNKQDAIQGLAFKVGEDSRVRCAYNVVGSETGRLACYESNDGTGTNLQTITKKHRRCFIADEGYEMGQLDLSGADSWTVAAWSAALGDSTMLDDLLYGLKPAKNIALAYLEGNSVMRQSRDWLKSACKTIDGEGWQYFAAKRVLHGDNYMMGPQTMSDQILKDSYKFTGEPIYVEPKICEALAAAKNVRYSGVKAWHRHCATLLRTTGKLKSASGGTRIFLGRRDDVGTLKEWLAHEPQANTTYATNLALGRLWSDPENRRPDGSLQIEPLHQVHDALLVQWRREDRAFALAKLHSYFNNPLTIAGRTVTIPFEGTFGDDWGMHRHDCGYYNEAKCTCDIGERTI